MIEDTSKQYTRYFKSLTGSRRKEMESILAGYGAHWKYQTPCGENNYIDWVSEMCGGVGEWSNKWTNEFDIEIAERREDGTLSFRPRPFKTAEECKKAAEESVIAYVKLLHTQLEELLSCSNK